MADQLKRVPNSADPDTQLSVMLPASVVKAVKMLAVQRGETLRITVLRALQALGIKVPSGAMVDRRTEANRLKGRVRRSR